MLSDHEWDIIRALKNVRSGTNGAGALRIVLLGGMAAAVLAILAVPYIDSEVRARVAGYQGGGEVDTMTTSSTRRGGNYTIRRSVLQANPNSVCIIGEGGGRSGACQ